MNNQVTIGIPVYNEAPFIEAALLSAIAQQVPVIVGDNASTDGTQETCFRVARNHPCVTYIRHETNLGALRNFKYCLDAATTPYFMWLGGHDLLPEGYVSALEEALDSDPEAVLAFGTAQHIDRDGRLQHLYEYSFAALLGVPNVLRRMT